MTITKLNPDVAAFEARIAKLAPHRNVIALDKTLEAIQKSSASYSRASNRCGNIGDYTISRLIELTEIVKPKRI